MEIVRRTSGGEQELAVRVSVPDATLGELAEVLGGDLAGIARIHVDGRPVRADAELAGSGLCRGSVVSADAGAPAASPAAPGAPHLCVIGGLDAGEARLMPPGTYVIGRDAGCDVVFDAASVSRQHCELTIAPPLVEVRDLGSKGGTWVDGVRLRRDATLALVPSAVVEIGTIAFVVRPAPPEDRSMAVDPARFAGDNGEIPFNRPPRPAPTPAPAAVRQPKAPTVHEKPRINVVAVVAPLVGSAVMVVATKNLLYAIIAGLTPVMAIFNWLDSRRQAGRTAKASDRTFRTELQEFRDKVARITALERQRREAAHPDLPEILRRATLPSVRLWERRANHPDYLHVSLAHGPLPWQPPVEQADYGATPAREIAEVVETASVLQQVPITADLALAGPVGIVGERTGVLALARALVCQAAVLHGPSDLPILVLADDDRAADWDWSKWLPHVRDLHAGDERLLLSGERACNRYVEAVLDAAPARRERGGEVATPFLFAVVDSDTLTRGKQAPVRDLLKGHRVAATGIVVAPSEDLLPAACTTVVQCHEVPGEVTVTRPQQGVSHPHVVVAGVGEARARRCARALARFEDPEITVPGVTLPRSVRVGALLGPGAFDTDTIRRRWSDYGRHAADLFADDRERKPPMEGPFGRTESSVLALDIVGDGPHGLVGGTTGSGKTELLRSIVLGLAANAGPEHLNFVFIDFKGGAGFERLAQLPHSVGLATNLNGELTERLLVCLQAELDHRQRRFREAAAPVDELHKYWQAGGPPLPRLLVVVDELAELVSAVPEFSSALVRIGRIGRTLGVHLLLATQRPGSVITTELRENTNYAIALRVREASNSVDIIGVPDAAAIPARNAAGRAFLRVGGDGSAPTLFQSAYSSAPAADDAKVRVEVAPFAFGPNPEAAFADSPRGPASGPTELERLVDAMTAAFVASRAPAPRRPWTDPLPSEVPLEGIVPPAAASAAGRPRLVTLALADDLAAQAQRPFGWDLARGNLLLYGVVGSGTTTALAAVALAVERLFGDLASTYVLDCAAGDLLQLEPLGSVGAVVTSAESERQLRLVRMLVDELKERKASPRAERQSIFLLIDSFGGLTAAADGSSELLDGVHRIFSEGPDVGIHTAAGADRPQAVPYRLADVAPQKWVMRLAEAADYTGLGLPRRSPADVPPGRAFVAGTGLALQIGRPLPDVGTAVAAQGAGAGRRADPPPGVRTLPDHVPLATLLPKLSIDGDVWQLPVGLADRDLQPYCLRLHRGEHAVVAGSARSGKTSVLGALATLVRRGAPDCRVVALLGKASSPLGSSDQLETVTRSVDELVDAVERGDPARPVLLLVDDANLVPDPTGRLEQLLAGAGPQLHAVAAGRTDDLRQAFGHWTQTVRKCRTGVVLKVAQPADGDAIGVTLPFARSYDTRPGRGYGAVDGEVEIVQVMLGEDRGA